MLVEGSETGKYKVRLVNPNGNSEETIKEIILAVDHLHFISSQIFSSIKKRVEEERSQVTAIDARVDAASHKIEKVKSIHKAIRIISPTKYPLDLDGKSLSDGGRHLNFPLRPLLAQGVHDTIHQSGQVFGELEYIEKRKSLPLRFDAPIKHADELLACYHVREPHIPPLQLELKQPGLGSPPHTLHLMDSFLLFNSAQNP
jgi:hypothetical protein